MRLPRRNSGEFLLAVTRRSSRAVATAGGNNRGFSPAFNPAPAHRRSIPSGFVAAGIILAAGIAVLSAGCGYHLRGTGSFLPPEIRTISIPVFKNLTTRYELDVNLTRAVIDEMVARAKITVVPAAGKADAVLEGEVLSFTANPVAFNSQSRADNYTITVVARITLTESSTKKALFTNPRFTYNQAYNVPQGRDFESVQTEAIQKIAESFARSLVATILEGF